jgi:hypothetical protein
MRFLIVVVYLIIGLTAGLAMARAVPAMNALGVAYIALTWPYLVAANWFDWPVAPEFLLVRLFTFLP